MGSAMARGWLRDPGRRVSENFRSSSPSAGEEVADGGQDGHDHTSTRKPQPADIVVLAMKPQGFAKAASDVAEGWIGPNTLVVSIMAGVTIARRSRPRLGVTKVARAMPNTPGAIGMGVTGFALSSKCGEAEKAATEKLLAPLGGVVGPLDEDEDGRGDGGVGLGSGLCVPACRRRWRRRGGRRGWRTQGGGAGARGR